MCTFLAVQAWKYQRFYVYVQEWVQRVARRSLQAFEPSPFSYGPELAPESASEGEFFAQARSFENIHSAAPGQALAAPAPAAYTHPASVVAQAPVPDTAVPHAETAAAPAASSASNLASESAAAQGASEAAGRARNESAGSSPCDGLEGGPTEWMKNEGAMGLACAQQVSQSSCKF